MFICEKCCKRDGLEVEGIQQSRLNASCEVCEKEKLQPCFDRHWTLIPSMVKKYQKKKRTGRIA